MVDQTTLANPVAGSSLTDSEKIKNYHEMIGLKESSTRALVVKRFNLNDIFITKDDRAIIERAMAENYKFVRIGVFTIILSTISAIEPREGIY